eukprot:1188808-Prorocentrum_minimum.AAC.5
MSSSSEKSSKSPAMPHTSHRQTTQTAGSCVYGDPRLHTITGEPWSISDVAKERLRGYITRHHSQERARLPLIRNAESHLTTTGSQCEAWTLLADSKITIHRFIDYEYEGSRKGSSGPWPDSEDPDWDPQHINQYNRGIRLHRVSAGRTQTWSVNYRQPRHRGPIPGRLWSSPENASDAHGTNLRREYLNLMKRKTDSTDKTDKTRRVFVLVLNDTSTMY